MDLQLDQKLCLVTGSTKGIGLAIARRLYSEGARVLICGQSQQSLDAALDEFADSTRVTGFVVNMADAVSVKTLAEKTLQLGTPDVLVQNVGYFEVQPFFECTDVHWQLMFELNVMSGVRLSRLLMPSMLQRGSGRVLFISSEQSAKPNPEMAHYAMSKTAQVSIARSLAELTSGTGLTVNSLLVAPTWTPGVETFLAPLAEKAGITIPTMQTEYFKGDGISSLIQRFAQPAEIADFASFICSPLSSAVNGAALRVDGGIIRSLF